VPNGAILVEIRDWTGTGGVDRHQPHAALAGDHQGAGLAIGGARLAEYRFFHLKTRQPIYPLQVLSCEERDRIAALCGPHPATADQRCALIFSAACGAK
jgi:hypothetical protein